MHILDYASKHLAKVYDFHVYDLSIEKILLDRDSNKSKKKIRSEIGLENV